MQELEEVIRDLLHSTINIRKKAFEQIKESWNLDLRPYVWIAIENEKNKRFQSEIVEFIIDELKEKSLRKMIRFMEKGQLYPPSIRFVVIAYLAYETPEARNTLIKSLKREKSKTHIFMEKLLTSNKLEMMGDEKVLNFLADIFDNSIDEKFRYKFAQILVKQKNPAHNVKPYRGDQFIKNFGKDPVIRRAILTGIREDDYIWSNWDWKEKDRNSYSIKDIYLLESIKDIDSKVRKLVIEIFSKLYLTTPSPKNSQREIIHDIWSKLIQLGKDNEFISLENYSEDALHSFFAEEYHNYLDEMLMFEIHPYQLTQYIIANLPRKILLQLAGDDPIAENRLLCYEGLTNRNFWIQYDKKKHPSLIGPHLVWVNMILRCLTALKFETSKKILTSCINLLMLLLELLSVVNKVDFEKIINLLEESGVLKKLEELKENSFSAPVVFQLLSMIKGSIVKIEINDTLSIQIVKILVLQLLNEIEHNNSIEVLMSILDLEKDDIRKQLIEEIDYKLDQFESMIAKNNILKILEKAKNDTDIRIRGYARLLIKRLND